MFYFFLNLQGSNLCHEGFCALYALDWRSKPLSYFGPITFRYTIHLNSSRTMCKGRILMEIQIQTSQNQRYLSKGTGF